MTPTIAALILLGWTTAAAAAEPPPTAPAAAEPGEEAAEASPGADAAGEPPYPAPGDDPADPEGLVILDQGWTDALREQFYFTPQGSHIMPNAWFRALERLDGEGRFSDADNLARYGFIAPDAPTEANANRYPIGFSVEDMTQGEDMVGLTCAACHTATVTVDGRPIRIDGAPSHADLDSFYGDLSRTVTATLLDEARFAAFAGRVLDEPTPEAAGALKGRLAAFHVGLAGDAELRRPALASGFGRVDALTQIINSLAVRDQKEPANLVPVAAPTSYPPLWLAPQLEFVQWSPIAASPIGRNGGQVLGVFGRTELAPGTDRPFASTMRLDELDALETWLHDLQPPRWNEVLMGPIDPALAAKGETLFAENCKGCHNMAPYERTDPKDNYFGRTFIRIGKIPVTTVGTDPAYIQALATRLVRPNAVTAPLFGGEAVVPAAQFFVRTVGATMNRTMEEAGLSDLEKARLHGFRFHDENGEPVLDSAPPDTVTKLKAGPLAAVWATGPYLHNGSVPTVYELLSPEEERRDVFWTGARELDRERLGYVSGDAPGRFRFDTSLLGNGNQGHLYPADGLTHDERMAIIEYLKTQ